jgi:hypothetical protein
MAELMWLVLFELGMGFFLIVGCLETKTRRLRGHHGACMFRSDLDYIQTAVMLAQPLRALGRSLCWSVVPYVDRAIRVDAHRRQRLAPPFVVG